MCIHTQTPIVLFMITYGCQATKNLISFHTETHQILAIMLETVSAIHLHSPSACIGMLQGERCLYFNIAKHHSAWRLVTKSPNAL